MTTWFAWVMIALIILRPLAGIALIGRPRKVKPFTALDGICGLVGAALWTWGILALAGAA